MLIKKYANFPKFAVAAHLLNATSQNVPVMIVSSLFGLKFAGFYAFANRLVLRPISLIGNSYGDIFRQKAAAAFAEKGECKGLYIEFLKKLLLIALVPSFILFIGGEKIFEVAFGQNWNEAGKLASHLSVLLLIRFISAPLGNMFIIAEKQRLDLIWQTILFLLLITPVAVFQFVELDFFAFVDLMIVCLSVGYLLNIVMTYKFALGNG